MFLSIVATLFSAVALSLTFPLWRTFRRTDHPARGGGFQIIYLAIAVAILSVAWSLYYVQAHPAVFDGP